MSKRSRGSYNNRRGTIATSNRWLPELHLTPLSTLLQMIEDRRQFHPEREARPARSFSSSLHRLQVPSRPMRVSKGARGSVLMSGPSYKIGFVAPRKVLICVRRKQRREVLHALHKTGRSGPRRPSRRSYYSDVRC